MNEILDQLLADDEATTIEVTWIDGEPVAYCTVDEEGDEIAVYDDCGGLRDDRDPKVLAAAKEIMTPSNEWATTYPLDDK
jgi:hypothetical protein